MTAIAGQLLAACTGKRESRVGVDPIEQIFLMENHDEAYRVWREADVRKRILIHIDAHHDMWWIPEDGSTTIANFICPALKEEMVREIFWVVPDKTWELSRSRKAVLRHLRAITAKYPDGPRALRIENRRISTVISGKPFIVCSVDSLPSIDEDVLLDIDVDYLMIPYVSHGESDTHDALPWCWPDELLGRLRSRNIRADFVTISYSVEGGYTPLKWKYVGDELAELLGKARPATPILGVTRLLREGSLAAFRGEFDDAEQKYREAIKVIPEFAASHYHLAQLYMEITRVEDSRECYRRAAALDPTYRTANNTAGLLYQSKGRFKRVEGDLLRTLEIDPEDAYANYGVGQIAAQRKQWREAESWLKKSLALDDKLIDAHRAIGNVQAKQGRYDEAISAYESSLKLSLAGHKSLAGPIITNEEDERRVQDPEHCRIHAQLARLYEITGAIDEAINGYRISAAGGYDGVVLRSRLARLYAKRSEWRKSLREIRQALKMIPVDLRKVGYGLHRRLRSHIKAVTKPNLVAFEEV